ncbi:polyphosphate polymerase domain-containing protein [Microbacterium sp.]|uniref:polyphosphate polymerase domain-containing protein n=1 Tax=Microbacterium sp. TaxID=51671 RepID=UPI0028A7EAA2|nr:polyphosphate polymerase domain-containing protein [Microbacterium sp.]
MSTAALLADRAPISLAQLDATASLMTRVDRKYFVPQPLLADLIGRLDGRWRVLDIDGRRAFRYRTMYFDSSRFDLFRQHVQRRRNRFKVRTRLYCDSGDCLLEVKSKGLRGRTVKQRIPHDPLARDRLDARASAFSAAITDMGAAQLHPVLKTLYLRSTLTDGARRITLDADLSWSSPQRRIDGPGDVLVETKSDAGAGTLDRMLLQHGIRPHAVSKYCLGASLLYPHLPGNDWARLRRRYWPGAVS